MGSSPDENMQEHIALTLAGKETQMCTSKQTYGQGGQCLARSDRNGNGLNKSKFKATMGFNPITCVIFYLAYLAGTRILPWLSVR